MVKGRGREGNFAGEPFDKTKKNTNVKRGRAIPEPLIEATKMGFDGVGESQSRIVRVWVLIEETETNSAHYRSVWTKEDARCAC